MEGRVLMRGGEADTAQVALYDRTRREALGQGLIAGGAVVCASAIPGLLHAGQAFAAADKGDAQILRGAVGLEQTAVVAYGAALEGATLDRGFAATVARILRQEQEHAAALTAALRGLGGTPPRPPRPRDVRGLAALKTQRQVATFAIELENVAVAAYYRALQRLRSPSALRTAAQVMASEGQHLVVLRQALGRDPLPNAFEAGRSS